MSLKEMFADMKQDVGAEVGRQATLGRAELASALFTGQAFTQYGEGQQSVEQGKEVTGPEPPGPTPQVEQQMEIER